MRKNIFYLLCLLSIFLGVYFGMRCPMPACSNPFAEPSPVITVTPSPEPIAGTPTRQPTESPTQAIPTEPISTEPDIVPVIQTPAVDTQKNNPSLYNGNGILGHLIVDGKSVLVHDSIDAVVLEDGPGWMPNSALPGSDGMSVILGHRNRNHLKLLEDVEVGDTILFRFVSDNHLVSYTVTEVQIFEETADWTLPVTDENLLVIATCYPFRYTGNAPGKFQVVAKRIE